MTAGVPAGDVRVALIGYGLGGRSFHAPFIATTPGMKLVAVVTGDADRQRDARADYPDANVIPSADQLFLGDHEVDLIVISTPNKTHAPLAMAAAAHGFAVVVDKPLATTSEDARNVVDVARDRGTFLSVYQNRRWDGDFRTVGRLVREGKLGTVYRFESRFERWRPTPKPGWRERGGRDEGGGLLFDLGSHLIDQALTLFGPVTRVYAEPDRRRPSVEVDDDVFISLTHASGVRSHLWASAVAAQSGPRFRVLGSDAGYTKYGMDVQEERLRSGAKPVGDDWGVEARENWGVIGTDEDLSPVPTERGQYGAFYAGVVRSLRDGAPPPVDPSDAITTLEIIEQASTQRAVG
jgi:scyllo-inositol 2-dehydrogenase (NADP+)